MDAGALGGRLIMSADRLDPVVARRGVELAIACGACGHLVAQRLGDVLALAEETHLDMLPAVIECGFCRVPNLLDWKQLNVRPDQSAARAERMRRGARYSWPYTSTSRPLTA